MIFDNIIAERESKTVYRDGNKRIKVFNQNFSMSDVLNEALNQSRIAETELNVPKITEVTSVDGKYAIVAEYIEGISLSHLIVENPDKIDEYIDLFVNLHLAVQSKTCPDFYKLSIKLDRKIAQTKLPATIRFDLHTRLLHMPDHPNVCHGDFVPSNIIIAKDGTPYIIDWSHATRGDGVADVARTYLLLNINKQSEFAEKYINRYCEISGIDKKYVEKWIPIVAAALSLKGNEEARTYLLKWAEVVDND